ncbi:MAG: N-acetylmuramoyl-L-alanine amidase CwlD [Sporolactobacillus sp.]
MQRRWMIAGVLMIVLAAVLIGLRGWITSRHTEKSWNLPLAGRVIVVDAGHGGIDGGAVGGSTVEKEITLIIARDVRNYLQETGAIVVMTRDSDDDLSDDRFTGRHKTQDLLRRASLTKKSKPDAFISIHLNAIPDAHSRGAQTFYYPKSEKNSRLASLIQDSLRQSLENTNRLAKAIHHVYLLKKATPPAALVEIGFLSNPTERALLVRSDYQKAAAAAVCHGIMRYFSNEKIKTNP